LYNLAQVLPECWAVNRKTVAFTPDEHTRVDLYLLLGLQTQARCDEAAGLLAGEFLEGLYLEENPEFEHWLLAERESWRGRAEAVMMQCVDTSIQRGRYTEALEYTRRWLQLTPWNEQAHQQVMCLLTWTGQRGEALHQFESCKRVLWEELGVEPAAETMALYEQIMAGRLKAPQPLPAFLTSEDARHPGEPVPFVARERQLAQMDTFLQSALNGRGRVIFITGGPGRGKTALLNAFASQAVAAHPDLLVASGSSNAITGMGDPYQPFRDIMAMLTGDVEAKWEAGAITREHARRLWAVFPGVARILLDRGPHLLDVLVPSAALISRLKAVEQHGEPLAQKLQRQLQHPGRTIAERSYLYQQVTELLQGITQEWPLLLMLDDVQWADAASIDLLFHIGRRMEGMKCRVLIACAYRPEEVELGRNGDRHPLSKVLNEYKRTFGDRWIGLGGGDDQEDRAFVEAFLDSEPNRLEAEFREALFQRTRGHPLFTSELWSALQERGDLVQDAQGVWEQAGILNWAGLPARVEAVFEERFGRLNPELQAALSAASVEGELFTAQVVGEVQKIAERRLLHLLTGELERRHRLIKMEGEVQARGGRMSRYRFGHVLFQEYVYRQLSPGERRLMHGEIASALEKLYAGQLDEMAAQLGRHFLIAEDHVSAWPYFEMAADRAALIHANDEAISLYARAIELANHIGVGAAQRLELYHKRGLACQMLGEFDQAHRDLEFALEIARTANEERAEWRVLLDLGKLWASRDYRQTRIYFELALELARGLNDPAIHAESLNWMGNWYANAEIPAEAVACHQAALEIFEALKDQKGLANTLDLLGIANLLGAHHRASLGFYERAITLFEDLDDRPRQMASLMGRGTIPSLRVLLATAPAASLGEAQHDLETALQIAQEIHAPSEEAWGGWSLGLLKTVSGQFGEALEVIQRGLMIATEIEHREWIVGNRFALGVLYIELFAPEEARQQLEQALTLAKGLQSQYWIHHVVGALSAAYLLREDAAAAGECLGSVLTAETSMDTMGKRYCWTRRAELALVQDDPSLALEIVQGLIESAPGSSNGSVITFLWKVKGEALAAMGQTEKAYALLDLALDSAHKNEERFLEWRVHTSLGRYYCMQNQPQKANREFAAARAGVRMLADTMPEGALKDGFLTGTEKLLGVE
jgi:tetratricopeptide (TPR) repeat protein